MTLLSVSIVVEWLKAPEIAGCRRLEGRRRRLTAFGKYMYCVKWHKQIVAFG